MAEDIPRVSIIAGSDQFEEDPLPVLSNEQERVLMQYLRDKIGNHQIKKLKFEADFEDGDDPGFLEIRLIRGISLENAKNIIQSLINNLDDEEEYIKLWIGRMFAERRR